MDFRFQVWISAFKANPSYKLELKDFTLNNFIVIFFERHTITWIINSLIIALASPLIVTVLAVLAAYPIARIDFRGKTLLQTLMILSMSIPLSAVLVPTYSLIRALGLVNSLIGVILILAGRQMPMAIWVLAEFIKSLPRELEEAAWIDGCGKMETIFRIIFPLSLPGIAVVFLMSFVGAWGDFLTPLIVISSDELKPIAMGLYDAACQSRAYGYTLINYGLLSAVSIVYMIIPAIIYLILGKYMIKGMVIGAVKG